jgi:hypothetical protein
MVQKTLQKKIFIKTARSKIKMAENYLFSYGYRNPPAIFSPTELNKMLKRDVGKPHGLSDNETHLRLPLLLKFCKSWNNMKYIIM